MRFQVLAIAVDVLGQHRHQRRRHGQQDGGCGRDAQHRRVVRVSTLSTGASMVWNGWFCFDHDRERHVLGRHRLAVMEQRILAQMQRQRGAHRATAPRIRPDTAAASSPRQSAAGWRRAARWVAPWRRRTAPRRSGGAAPASSRSPACRPSWAFPPRRPSRARTRRAKPARICLALRMSLPLESWSIGRFVHADGLGSSVATRRSRA